MRRRSMSREKARSNKKSVFPVLCKQPVVNNDFRDKLAAELKQLQKDYIKVMRGPKPKPEQNGAYEFVLLS